MCSNLFPCLTLEDVSWYLILTVDTWGLFLPFSTGPDYARFWVTKAHRKWIILGLKCLRVSTCFWIFHYNWKLLHFLCFLCELWSGFWVISIAVCLFLMWCDCWPHQLIVGCYTLPEKRVVCFGIMLFASAFSLFAWLRPFYFQQQYGWKKNPTHCSILCSRWPRLPLPFYILTNKNHNPFCSFSS